MFVARHFHMDKLAAAHYPVFSSAELIATSQARSATGASYKIHPHTALLCTSTKTCKAGLHLLGITLYSFIAYSKSDNFVFLAAPKATQHSSNFLFSHPKVSKE